MLPRLTHVQASVLTSSGIIFMSETTPLLVFYLDGQGYALALEVVERVVRAAEITPLPQAPEIVWGALDVEGEVLPVLNVRRRFQLVERPIGPSEQFLIARAGGRRVILVIDSAREVVEALSADITSAAAITPGLVQFRGVVRMKDGLVLIHDLERFLSLEESAALEKALDAEALHEN